ncbi:S1C family serine protease, partial [Chloroflexota bacterium]
MIFHHRHHPPPTTTTDTTPIDSEWSITPAGSQAPILPSIADVIAKVKPSVVAINTEVITLDIFNRPFTQEGAGSGWIISKDGIIMTNNHVVEGAESIAVTLDDGRTFPVDMNTVAADWLTDLAVLKIDAENLPAATVGDSLKLRVGDWVVAIGNSLGMGTSATTGIVSSLGVRLEVSPGQTLYDLVQTDAAINPGNSGGPLVNMAGEVIGINSVKRAQVEIEGVGYAISTNEAMPIVDGLITTGYIVRPWLGVTVDNAGRYNLAVDEGALIVNMASGSPADKAGLKVGDVITKFEDQEITEVNGLIRVIHSSQVG